MAISKKCLACNLYRDECTGSSTPCGQWTKLMLTPHDGVPAAAIGTPEDQDREAARQDMAPTEETHREKFQRIGDKRQRQALEAIRKLGHLTSKYHRKRTGVTTYTYEWTAADAQAIIKPIEEALEALKSELLAPDMPKEHGLIEEK